MLRHLRHPSPIHLPGTSQATTPNRKLGVEIFVLLYTCVFSMTICCHDRRMHAARNTCATESSQCLLGCSHVTAHLRKQCLFNLSIESATPCSPLVCFTLAASHCTAQRVLSFLEYTSSPPCDENAAVMTSCDGSHIEHGVGCCTCHGALTVHTIGCVVGAQHKTFAGGNFFRAHR